MEQLQQQAQKEIGNRYRYWKPFICGLAYVSEDTINNADPFELVILDEVLKFREEYLENRIVKSELVERKK